MQDIFQDPYRPILSLHVGDYRVSLAYLTGGRLLWFGIVDVVSNKAESDWSALNRIFEYFFPKVERIVIDNRPFAFLMNLFSQFKDHQWKCVFITSELLRYKFLRPLNEEAVIRFAEDWLLSSGSTQAIISKLQNSSDRVEVCLSLLCYMTFVTPLKHEHSNYRPTVNDSL